MRHKRKQILTIGRILCALLAVGALPIAPAAAASLVTSIVTDPLTGVAIEGFDPVSYFSEEEPQVGNAANSVEWGGVTWYFATPANRDIFARNPDIYAPQFGGHCLTGLSRGFLSDGKPRLYVIRGGKLYLFYSMANREAYLQSGEGLVARAERNWAKLSPQLTAKEPDISQSLEPAAKH